MVKHLLAVGCSFTEGGIDNGPHLDNPWPKKLGEMLDCEVNNLGLSGQGNDYIFTKTITEVSNNPGKYDLVCIMWTEAFRMGIPATYVAGNYITFNPSVEVWRRECIDDLNVMDWDRTYGDDYKGNLARAATFFWYFTYGTVHPSSFVGGMIKDVLYRWIDTWFTKIVALQEFLKSQGIKLIFSQGPDIISGMDSMNLSYLDSVRCLTEYIIENPITDTVDTDIWLNWPPVEPLGNISYLSQMWVNETTIDQTDSHPNEQGHEDIAKDFFTKYKKLYGS